MRAEMAEAEKQRKRQPKPARQHASFTLPRLRMFSRKQYYDEPQSADVLADDKKCCRQIISQQVSVSVVYRLFSIYGRNSLP